MLGYVAAYILWHLGGHRPLVVLGPTTHHDVTLEFVLAHYLTGPPQNGHADHRVARRHPAREPIPRYRNVIDADRGDVGPTSFGPRPEPLTNPVAPTALAIGPRE